MESYADWGVQERAVGARHTRNFVVGASAGSLRIVVVAAADHSRTVVVVVMVRSHSLAVADWSTMKSVLSALELGGKTHGYCCCGGG